MAKSVNKKEAEAPAQAAEGANAENQAPAQGQENPSQSTPEGASEETEAPAEQAEQTPAERLAELEALVAEKEARAVEAEDRAKQAEALAQEAIQELAAVQERSVAYRVSHRNAKRQHMFEMNRSPVVLRNGDLVDPDVVEFIKTNEIAIELEAI